MLMYSYSILYRIYEYPVPYYPGTVYTVPYGITRVGYSTGYRALKIKNQSTQYLYVRVSQKQYSNTAKHIPIVPSA